MAVIAPINAQTFPVGSFLTNNSCAIPELQRPYAWTDLQADELIYDLKRIIASINDDENATQNVPQHFFGTIVLLSSHGARLDIIDGQQRLTTVSLLLGLIRQSILRVAELASSKGGPAGPQVAGNARNLADGIKPLLFFQGPMDEHGRTPDEMRVLVSPEIRKTYESFLTGGDGKIPAENNAPAKNLRLIAKTLIGELIEEKTQFHGDPLTKLRYLKKVHDAVRDGLLVVSLQTASSDAGYDLFESLNARGVDLNTLDLIKVWMLNKLSGQDSTAVAKSMRAMASDNVKEQLEFFEDFYRARALRNTQKQTGKGLALLAREHVFKDPMFVTTPQVNTLTDRIVAEVSLMERWTPIWKAVRRTELSSVVAAPVTKKAWIEHRMSLLTSNLRHTGAVVPLFMVANDVLRNNPDKLSDLTHVIERFFFRFKVMCGGPVKEIETAYYKFIQALTVNNDINMTMVHSTLQALIDEHADDARFESRLRERLNYSLGAAAREKIMYFLWTIECYSYNKRTLSEKVQNLGSWHLEHIYPQNPQANGMAITEDVNGLGNICLLDPKINNQLSNLDFAAKRNKIATFKVAGNQLDSAEAREIFDGQISAWGDAEIGARMQSLVQQAQAIFKFV